MTGGRDDAGTHIPDEGGEAWSLYEKVDTGRLVCLNEKHPNSLRHILRPWNERLNSNLPTLDSDVDEQLLMCIPFVSPVKISSICVIGGGDEENPAKMSAYINRDVMDFDTAIATRPVQDFRLVRRNTDGNIFYPTKYSKFQDVETLWLFVERNFGADTTSVMYIGLRGDFARFRRKEQKTLGEAKPINAANDVMEIHKMPHQIS